MNSIRPRNIDQDEAASESPALLNLRHHFDALCHFISGTAARTFQESHDLAKAGLTGETLNDFLYRKIKGHMIRHEAGLYMLIQNNKDQETALNLVVDMKIDFALELAEVHYEEKLNEMLSKTDPLTGLPNRSAYEENLRKAISRNERKGETFSFILFDIDHFKKVNDTYGHKAGDQALQEMARRLKEEVNVRGMDFLFRYGGEEFGIILPATDKEGACVLAQRISDVIASRPFKLVDSRGLAHEVRITVSIGASELTSAMDDPSGAKVVGRADDSLYVLKGDKPDAERGELMDRRGKIACDSRIVTRKMVDEFRAERQNGNGPFAVHRGGE